MAILRIPDEGRTIEDAALVRAYLAKIGIDHERWEPSRPVGAGATAEEVLAAYSSEIDALKANGGYVTADVIDVTPEVPNLDAMLQRFASEHWHDEDEVRFILDGRGLFHVRPANGPVVAIEVGPGDLIRVPRGTWHWFDLCAERRIRAIRLFQDAAGWTPHYTGSGTERGYAALCMGPADFRFARRA
jgi:1,2-dihydroxy-3-keto-5-methylthiopentene dioxygenase